jgi:hypothetical protein
MKKKMKKITVSILCCMLLIGCSKDEPEPAPAAPQSPVLSRTSVSVEEGAVVEVDVSGGKSPYSVTVSPTGIAAAVVNGTKLTVTGVTAGNAVAAVKGSDGGSANLSITVTEKPDPLAAFKSDAVPRWELPDGKTVKSDDSRYVFITDGGKLFASTQNKWGYASLDGSTFRLIEWGTSPTMRTETGTVAVTDFQIVKEDGKTVWLTFKADGLDYRVAAKKV